MRGSLRLVWICGVALTCLSRVAFAQDLPWQYWTRPSLLARLDPSDMVLEHSSHCYGGCRYDRDGFSAPTPLANNPYPNRGLYSSGGEITIFDDLGAGALTRFWLTTGDGMSRCIDPAISAKIYLDGASTPTLSLPLAALFDGSTVPFQPPLVSDRSSSSGGYVSYVPITYAQGLRISLSDVQGLPNPCIPVLGGDPDYQHLLWYQFQYHRLPPGTVGSSFSAASTFPALTNFLAHHGDDPWAGGLAALSATTAFSAGDSHTLLMQNGSGWLRGLRLHVPRNAYDSLHLRVDIDGSSSIDLPLSAFFATPTTTLTPPRGVLLGEDVSGWVYAWFPMPFRQSVQVTLVADNTLAASTSVDSELTLDNTIVPADAAPFFATQSQQCGVASDLVLLTQFGAGRIVGISGEYHANGVTDAGYLEGDERVYIDGSAQPHWYGTGLEDFFNGGFYFDGGGNGMREYSQAFSGASHVDISATTNAWRLLLGDSLTWQNALDFRLEPGAAPNQSVPTCANVVFYGYGQRQVLLSPYAQFDVGAANASSRFGYQHPVSATCSALNGANYESEPPTSRSATSCHLVDGSSSFHFDLPMSAIPLRLRRVLDVQMASVPAQIKVNGVTAGYFPYAAADPLRYWQDQDAPLSGVAAGSSFAIEVIPLFGAPSAATQFSESAYALWGAPTDGIFRDGFDLPSP
ncbi:DUF2961 domain-containing protein [Pseudolysobacter antarcticus]|uniref:DUF2961 domain-containing protein n=1 Tax=Pseudolysobacter antarcticus TaxID=2511995 RepID=A0A411HND7_9GAMM|nr:DUF2961 domain-containing protein [Pseudolysobacter antarcticus]QBB71984.1 DUF2961 domain-containing protein [Pseudolysobacter antarcticus]